MLSNMVAHELKQPLGAIANFADGIRTITKGETEHGKPNSVGEAGQKSDTMELIGIAADEIIGQTQRASAIIERVRGYAKSGAGKQIEKR